jgi:plasmid maintenance system killer protein
MLKDLAALLGNRLEALRGDRKGQYSTHQRPVADMLRMAFRRARGRQTLKSLTIIEGERP